MFSLTRFLGVRVAPTAFRAINYGSFQRRIPIALSRRPFSTGNLTIFAPAANRKTTTSNTSTKKATSSKKKTTPSTKSKPRAKAKPKKVATKTTQKKAAKPKKAATPKPSSTRVPLKDRPPPKPAGAFFLYLRRAFNPVGKSMAEAQKATQDAAATWRNMTESEKQPFFDESKILMDDYQLRRDKWYKDPKNGAVLRMLNKDRKKRGKKRIHRPASVTAKKPLTPFFRYLQELRATNELSRENAPPGAFWITWSAREAGARWKALPPSVKEKYTKAYESEVAKAA